MTAGRPNTDLACYQRILYATLDDAARELPPSHLNLLITLLVLRARNVHGATIDPA